MKQAVLHCNDCIVPVRHVSLDPGQHCEGHAGGILGHCCTRADVFNDKLY